MTKFLQQTFIKHSNVLTLNFLSNLFCWRFLMDGLVSNEWGRFLFFADTMAAAAATPTGPKFVNKYHNIK